LFSHKISIEIIATTLTTGISSTTYRKKLINTMSTSSQPAFDPNVVSEYAAQKWNDLDPYIKEAAAMLGYTEEDWDGGKVTHLLKDKDWDGLDTPKRDAAKKLGWDEQKWNRIYATLQK
jgi:hypothetical protein